MSGFECSGVMAFYKNADNKRILGHEGVFESGLFYHCKLNDIPALFRGFFDKYSIYK